MFGRARRIGNYVVAVALASGLACGARTPVDRGAEEKQAALAMGPPATVGPPLTPPGPPDSIAIPRPAPLPPCADSAGSSPCVFPQVAVIRGGECVCVCGVTCAAGQVQDPISCACQDRLCASAGASCGTITVTMGNASRSVDCGTCSLPQTCGGGGVPNKCGCTPQTPAQACIGGQNCGSAPDNCGGVVTCGTCVAPATCGGGPVPNQCGCTPFTAAQACAGGRNCGTAPDGCGGDVTCGACVAPETCGGGGAPGHCGCTPLTPPLACAGGQNCGTASDGCGSDISCGACTAPETCGGGGVHNQCGRAGIVVVSASYGSGNCGTPVGNVTGTVAGACNGLSACDVFVHNNVFGDPAYGCPKDFTVDWRCGGDPSVHTAGHGPVAGEGYSVSLSCP